MRLAGLSLRRRVAVAALCALCAGPVPAAVFDLALDVPPDLDPLIRKNLDLDRWEDLPELGPPQRQRLERELGQRVRTLLETDGYYAPEVRVRIDATFTPPRLEIGVIPHEPVRVSSLDLRLTGEAARDPDKAAALRANWRLPPGARFRHAEWEAAKRAALAELLAERYPAARIVESQATVDIPARSVALALTLDSGPAYAFGEVEITGLERYPRALVDRLNPIEPGAPYRQRDLLTLQARLRDSPYFSSASVRADPSEVQDGRIPVRVEVQERRAKRLGLGLGLTTDVGPRGSVEYRDFDFRDRAWRLSGNLVADARRQTLSGRLNLPPSAEGHEDQLSARLERSDIANEITQTLGLGAQRAQRRGQQERIWAVDYLRQSQRAGVATRQSFEALSLSHTWLWRAVDDPVFPSRGHLYSLQLGGGARALLSERDFLRTHARAAWYRPLGAAGSLLLRGELGAIAAGDRTGLPGDLLFRTGGDQSVRGYGYLSLGVPQDGAIVGGRYLAVASAEYVHWFKPRWGAAVFLDAGNAADRLADLTPVRGYGLGLRWRSPVGPLNLDLAHGEAVGGLRLHFTVNLGF